MLLLLLLILQHCCWLWIGDGSRGQELIDDLLVGLLGVLAVEEGEGRHCQPVKAVAIQGKIRRSLLITVVIPAICADN